MSGPLSYGDYLHLPELLAQQEPATSPPAHDELLFITVHQVHELWFKVLLHELTDARDLLLDGRLALAGERLRRAVAIEGLLTGDVDVLDTMPPGAFDEFRGVLAPASGFQSVQYREIEFLSGAKDPRMVDRVTAARPGERDRLRHRLDEPSLWDGYLAALGDAGFDVTSPDGVDRALAAVAGDRERHARLWEVADLLVAHDRAWAEWRGRHALVAERQIGGRPGTAGTAGVAFLRKQAEMRFFPQLWAMRPRP